MTIFVKRAGAAERSYAAKTDKDGRFHASGVDLKKDDQVYIRLQARNSSTMVDTEAVTPTFPFDKAIMLEADFFNDYEKAYIPTVIVKDWVTDKLIELKFDVTKVPGSTITINGKPVSGQNQYGEFVHTGNNVLPFTNYQAQLSSEGFVIGPSNTILSRVFGIVPELSKSTFSDIIYVNPYIPEINAAVSYGIMSGYPDGSFGPKKNITFNEMAVMLSKVQELVNRK